MSGRNLGSKSWLYLAACICFFGVTALIYMAIWRTLDRGDIFSSFVVLSIVILPLAWIGMVGAMFFWTLACGNSPEFKFRGASIRMTEVRGLMIATIIAAVIYIIVSVSR